MRTTYIAKIADVERKWYVVDASGKTLGRDYVIVINAEKVVVTGKKLDQKIYAHHSGYVGGLKTVTLKQQLEKKPEEVLKHAVKGMLPKNALGRKMFSKLHVYAGPEHAHAAQKPEALELKF